jgi:hypothetical protein
VAKEPDPRAEFATLAASLSNPADLKVAYVLRGAETWFRSRALELVLQAARARGLELCRHDPKDPDFRAQSLSDDLTSQAMFAAQRCVVIAEPEGLLKKVGGEEAALARAIRSFVKGRRGTVVLNADALRADNATLKELVAAGGAAHTFRRLYERPGPWERDQDPRKSELVGFVLGRAKELGVALNAEHALLVVHAHGNDLSALDTLLRSAAERGAGDLLAGLGSAAAGSPGEVADALIAGDLPRAQLALETLFRGGMRKEKDGSRETGTEALNAILLGYLRPRVRQGLAAAQARQGGATLESALSEAGVTSFDRGLREAIGARPLPSWAAMLDDLLELERSSRRGVDVDVNHWTTLALRWRVRAKPAASPAGARR